MTPIIAALLAASFLPPAGRPRLILTPERIWDLKASRSGSANLRARLEAEGEILYRDDRNYWRLLSNHRLIEAAALGTAGLALEGESSSAGRFLTKALQSAELIVQHAPLDGAWSECVQYGEYGLSPVRVAEKGRVLPDLLLAAPDRRRIRQLRRLLQRPGRGQAAIAVSPLHGGCRVPQRPLPGLCE